MGIKLSDLDHPLIFLLVISLGVAAVWALLGWGLAAIGATGPLGLFKGGATYGMPYEGSNTL